MLVTKTPLRVSLFGGGTDIPSFFNTKGGAVLGGAIDHYIYCAVLKTYAGISDYSLRLAYRKSEYAISAEQIAHPAAKIIINELAHNMWMEITITADLPARVGLGSSSTFTVGMFNALSSLGGTRLSADSLARNAIRIERIVLNEPGGWQDQIFAAYGGFNFIRFDQGNSFSVHSLTAEVDRIKMLEQHLLLYFTGVSRDAGKVEQEKVDRISSISSSLSLIKDHAYKALDIFSSDVSMEGIGHLLHETWLMKRSLTPSVSLPHIDQMYAKAIGAGALGGKLLGAGGGGFLLLFSPLDKVSAVQAAMHPHAQVPFSFVDHGSTLYQI